MDCMSKVNCSHCKKRHNTALCIFRDNIRQEDHRSPNPSSAESINIASCVQENKDSSCATAALQTAQALTNSDRELRVRVIFDSGSQKSFIIKEIIIYFFMVGSLTLITRANLSQPKLKYKVP